MKRLAILAATFVMSDGGDLILAVPLRSIPPPAVTMEVSAVRYCTHRSDSATLGFHPVPTANSIFLDLRFSRNQHLRG